MKTRIQNLEWKHGDCRNDSELFDRRTPGVFNLEFFCSRIITLTSKTYICDKRQNEEVKMASKGLSTNLNQFHMGTYLNVLKMKHSGVGTNKDFVCRNHQVFSYTQKRAGLSFFYGKQKVLKDGIMTRPLNLLFTHLILQKTFAYYIPPICIFSSPDLLCCT